MSEGNGNTWGDSNNASRQNNSDKPEFSDADATDRDSGRSYDRPPRRFEDRDSGRSYDRPPRRFEDRDSGRSYDRPPRRFDDRDSGRSYERRGGDRFDDRDSSRSYERRGGDRFDDRRRYDDDRDYRRGGDRFERRSRDMGERRPRTTREDPTEPNETIGIFNLSYNLAARDFEDYLNEKLVDFAGKFTCKLILNNITGRCKGYGFVTFETLEDSTKAKAILENGEILGSPYRVAFSIQKRNNNFARQAESEANQDNNQETAENN